MATDNKNAHGDRTPTTVGAYDSFHDDPVDHRKRPQARKAATLVVQRIMSDIARRHLKAGDALAAERSMLEHYSVGRGTLREALRFLELQGIVTMKSGPGGGPIVAAPDSRHLANSLGLLLQMRGTPFGAVVEARLILEPHLAALAASRADDKLRYALRASVESMGEELGDADSFLQENRRFHQLIANAAGNPVFAYVMESLHWIIDGSSQGVQYPERYRAVVRGSHEKVMRAIDAQDQDAAEAAMRDHIENMLIYLRKQYPRSLEQPIRWEMQG